MNINALHVRKAGAEDVWELMRWRNDPKSIRHSISGKKVNKKEHLDWFQNLSQDQNILLYIGWIDGKSVGMVRFSKIVNSFNVEISINIAPEVRRIGIGTYLLKKAEIELKKEIGECTIVAKVMRNNIASINFFKKCDYHIFFVTDKIIELKKV